MSADEMDDIDEVIPKPDPLKSSNVLSDDDSKPQSHGRILSDATSPGKLGKKADPTSKPEAQSDDERVL